jgi:hypothetical protein
MVQAATGTLSSHYLQEVVAEQVWALVADELPQRALGSASV